MQKTFYLITLIILMLGVIGCQPETGTSENTNLEIQETELIDPPIYANRIKNATLLIRVESIQPEGVFVGYDMGTLIQHQGETYLVTHNHYGDMLQDMNIVQFRDAQNRPLQSMYAATFKSLIIYEDPGTLVLRAPDGLTDTLTPVSVDHLPQLQPGDIVQVAYRGGANRDQAEILNAVIENVTVRGGAPVYGLRCLDGQLLSPGDSGGGIWYGESFVGNNWSIVLTDVIEATSAATDSMDPTTMTQTDLSYAAIFPQIFP